MRRTLKAVVLLAVVAICSLAPEARAAATMTNNTWQSAGGSRSGLVTNAAHWAKGHVPIAQERMYAFNVADDYTMTFPAGAYTNAAALKASPAAGHTLTVNGGTDSSWVMSGSADGTTEVHDANPFRIYSGDSISLFDLQVAEGFGHTMAELTNPNFTVTGSDSSPSLVFDGGTYDFRDPADSDWTSATTKPVLYLNKGSGEATGTASFVFKNGASLRAWDVGIQTGARQGCSVLFDGGSHYIQKLNFPDTTVAHAYAYPNTSYLTLTNGATLSVASSSICEKKDKAVKIRLDGEGTVFEARGALVGAGSAGAVDLDVRNGAELRASGGATFVSSSGQLDARFVDAKLTGAAFTCGQVGGSGSASVSHANVGVTNSTVNLSGTLTLYYVSKMAVKDSSVGLNAVSLFGATWASPTLTVDSGAVTSFYAVTIDNYSELVVRGGEFVAAQYVNMTGIGAALTVEGGLFHNDFTKATSPSKCDCGVIYVGKASGTAVATLNVRGGEAKFASVYTGWNNSKGTINVSGGKLTTGDIRLANGDKTTDTWEHTINLTGGEIYIRGSLAAIGNREGAHARVNLHGGQLTCDSLQAGKSRTEGNVALDIDGGSIVARADSANFIRYFNEATVGAGGFTIDTATHTVTLDQEFTGTGTLTLTGGGTVAFTAGKAIAGPIVVKGGTTFKMNGVVANGLTLGDATSAAALARTASDPTVVVDGDLTYNDLTLSVSDLTVGTTVNVFAVTGALSEGTAAKWADISVTVPDGAAYDSEIVEVGGTNYLRLVIRDPQDITVATPAGTSETHATNIVWAVNDMMHFDVGKGGEMRTEGILRKGWLYKEGLGKLTLANPNNESFNGIKFILGTLAFDLDEDLAVDCPLWLAATNKSDVLRFESEKSVHFNELHTVKNDGGTGSVTISTCDQVSFDIPSTSWCPIDGALRIEEGEVKIRGTSAGGMGYTSFENGVAIGLHGKGGSRATHAGLVIDNLSFAASIGLASAYTADDVVEDLYIVATNNAVLPGVATLIDSCANPDVRVTVILDNSSITGNWVYNRYARQKVPPQVRAYNGSKILGQIEFRGDCDFLFDASTFDDQVLYYSNWQFTNNLTFVNGATCNASVFRSGWAGWYEHSADIRLTFDDSTFSGMGGDFGHHDPHLDSSAPAKTSNNPKVSVYAKGTGVKLSVPADTTYTWSYPLKDSPDGAGGFVKLGEGTLKVLKERKPDMSIADNFSFAQTGVTRVEAGVLDLDGNAWTDAALGGGAGVFSNGTVTATRIVPMFADGVCTAQPRLASDCTLSSGRVKVDVSNAGLEPDTQFVALTYAGTAPDVSKWRLTGDSNLRARFTASAGTVTASVVRKPGSVFILR